MIDELRVSDLALIERADLDFSSGLTVLTGETGAGKTALLSALRLICGQRADSKAVREGADEAQVEARCCQEGTEHIISRRLSSTGRSRCMLDGSMATVAQIAQAASSIYIHSQHEQIALLDPACQLGFLDRYIDPGCTHLADYSEALAAYRAASRRYKELEQASLTQDQELEYQRFVDAQISAVDPSELEYDQLEAQLPKLQNAAALAQACDEALGQLGFEGGAADKAAAAAAALGRAAAHDSALADYAARLDDISSQLDDFVRDLGSYARSIPSDASCLQETLDRLAALSGLMKRYGPTMEQVFSAWRKAKDCIQAADGDPQLLAQAKQERMQALRELQSCGESLFALRKEKSAELCERLRLVLAGLAMPDASFEFSFEDMSHARWTDSGPGTVELMYCPSPTAGARPLRKIASGGELSRILLALECVLRESGNSSADDTLVFDEVDSGIGGVTGEAVGRCLAELSKHCQVIVVTHLAQVAVHADAHYVVSKSDEGEGVVTSVEAVSGDQRVAEVARMLSGSADAVAIAHASSLLADAQALR